MKKLTVAQAVKNSAKYIAITNDRYGTKRIESGFSFCVGTFYDDNLNNSNINEFACSRKMFDKILSEKASEILENSDENVIYFYKDAEFEEKNITIITLKVTRNNESGWYVVEHLAPLVPNPKAKFDMKFVKEKMDFNDLKKIIQENGYRKFEKATVDQLRARCFNYFSEVEDLEIVPNELKGFDELFK